MVCRKQRISMLQRMVLKHILRMHRCSTQTLAIAILLTTTVVMMSGCNAFSGARDSWNYNSCWNSMMMNYRNEAWANKAWHRRKHQFCNERHFHEFCEGFRAGYMEIADGGNGCTPAFPPRQYWNWKYQSAEGQAKVAAWYAGYPHGARAAEEDGIGNWTQIQTSTGIQREYAQHGMLGPGQSPGMYPMPEALPPGQVAARGAAGEMGGYVEGQGTYSPNHIIPNNGLGPVNSPSLLEGSSNALPKTPMPFGSGVIQETPPGVVQ